MTRRRRAAAGPVDPKHTHDLENELRKSWERQQAPDDGRPENDGAAPPLLATRTRKARKDGQCPLCVHPIRVTSRVGLVPDLGWVHVSCLIRVNANRNLTPEE